MPKLVCVDSMICVWGIKKKPSKGQEHMVGKTESFLEYLEKEESILILPSPIITELLCPVPPQGRAELISKINKVFRIVPVDTIAAIKAGELWHDTKNWKDIYKSKKDDGLKNRFKYDILIAAVAITRNVDCLYTEDKKLTEICKNYIDVKTIPNIPKQGKLFEEPKNKIEIGEVPPLKLNK